VVRARTTGAEGPKLKPQPVDGILSVHPAVNGYLTLFGAGEGVGSEEEEWCPRLSYTIASTSSSSSSSISTVGSLTASSPTTINGYGTIYW